MEYATLQEIINRIDTNYCNDYSTEQKLKYIDIVNQAAYNALMENEEAPEEYKNLTYPADMNRALCICKEHDEIYDLFVNSKIAQLNNEMGIYNNFASLYNAAWDSYKRYLIRTGYIEKQPEWKSIEL